MRHPAGRAAALVLAAACGLAHAGARLDYASQGACPVLFRSIEVAGPRLRIEVEPAGGEPITSIFDGDEDLVTTLIPSQRKYLRAEVDADAAEYTGDVVASSMTYMDRQMARATEMMREQCKHGGCGQMPDLSALVARPPATPITTRDAAATDTVGGVACAWREWEQGGAVVRRECLADIADLPLPDADRAGLRRGLRVMTNYGKSMGEIVQRFGADPEPTPPPGRLPVAQQCFRDGVATGTVTLAAREAPIDPARFAVPDDYAPALGPVAE